MEYAKLDENSGKGTDSVPPPYPGNYTMQTTQPPTEYRPAIQAQQPPAGPAFQNYPVAQPGYNQAAHPQPGYNQPGYNQPGFSSNTSVVVNQPSTVVMAPMLPDSTGAIVFSCFVTWCCCFFLGVAAFFISVTARDSGTVEEVRNKLRIANILNITGTILGGVIITLWIIIQTVAGSASSAQDCYNC